ncbi:YneF family protein, partial [Klebsiella pneumoniae]|nr:YneF family protein [Klebsiella pneumoniae]
IEKEFADNPRLNAEAVRTLLSANGQKPSEAKVQQVYHQIIRQQKAALANNKKKK